MSITRPLLAATLLLAGIASGCAKGDTRAPRATVDEPSSTAPSADTNYQSLCVGLDAALAGDIDSARAAFDHGPLHELADTTIEIDRSAAARLLQAKEAVESALADETSSAGRVADDLRTLVDATAVALAASGESSAPLCEQGGP